MLGIGVPEERITSPEAWRSVKETQEVGVGSKAAFTDIEIIYLSGHSGSEACIATLRYPPCRVNVGCTCKR
jgi:hypothetical protein